jgi:hypothetical protein
MSDAPQEPDEEGQLPVEDDPEQDELEQEGGGSGVG